MADPGDTAALCNDTRTHILYEPGHPGDSDIEAGPVIGEEPLPQRLPGEEEEQNDEEEEGEKDAGEEEDQEKKTESKIPFIYMIVDPGCTPLSCYSSIVTFIIMSIGVIALLLISPPLNAKGEMYSPIAVGAASRKTNATEADLAYLDAEESGILVTDAVETESIPPPTHTNSSLQSEEEEAVATFRATETLNTRLELEEEVEESETGTESLTPNSGLVLSNVARRSPPRLVTVN